MTEVGTGAGARLRWDLTVGLVYLAAAVVVLGGLWAHPGAVNPATNNVDRSLYEWMLVHATRIFTHGENPFASPQLNAPLGMNVMANTGMLGLAIPVVPVTLLLGPAVSYVLLTTVGLAGTAVAWYLVLSRWLVVHRLAAAVAGGFAGFAPGMINHASGHPNLAAQFLISVIVWRALSLGERDHPRRVWLRHGVILGLLVTWQAFLNEELLLITVLASGVFVAAYAAFRPGRIAAAARPFLRGAAVATLTAGVLLGYPLWYQIAGPEHWHGFPDVFRFSADLASYPAFARLSLIGQPFAEAGLSDPAEADTFLGWPLLVAVAAIVVWLWRRVEVRALAIVGLIFVLLSLGATVHIRGRAVVPAPWGVLDQVPLFDDVLPARLGLVLIPVLAVLLALAIDQLVAQPSRVRLAIGLAAIAVALVPVVPRQVPVQPRPAVPAFITSGHWRRYLVGDRSMLSADTTAYGIIDAMAWGNATGQRYRMVGGFFLLPDPTGKGTFGTWVLRPTAALLARVGYGYGAPAISDAQRATAQADVRYWNAGLVVLADDAPYAADLLATLVQLFGPGQRVDDVWLWRLNPG